MKTPNTWFEPSRFMHLLKRDIATHYKSILVGMGAIASLFTFFLVFIPAFMDEPEPFINTEIHTGGYLLSLFLGGLWFTSGIWSDVNTTQQRQFFLTLPASDLEKYLSKWLLTGPVFLVIFTVAYWIFSFVINAFAAVYPGIEYWPLEFFDNVFIKQIVPYYFLVQPLFLAGGIWFGRFAFIKTALIVIIFEVLFIAFASWLGAMLFADLGEVVEQEINLQIGNLDQVGLGFLNTISWLLSLVSAIFFMVLGYIRLKERGA